LPGPTLVTKNVIAFGPDAVGAGGADEHPASVAAPARASDIVRSVYGMDRSSR